MKSIYEIFNINWNREEKKDKISDSLDLYEAAFHREDFYERKWKQLQYTYRKISLYELEFHSIGETIPRAASMILDFKHKESAMELNVVLPTFPEFWIGGIFNIKLLEILSRYLYIIDDGNIDFWKYVLMKHREDIRTCTLRRYFMRKVDFIPIEIGTPFFEFSQEEISEADFKMKQCGIKGSFVCVHARGAGNKRDNWNNKKTPFDYNKETLTYVCNMNTFRPACEYLNSVGLKTVKVGKFEDSNHDIEGLIDYSRDYSKDYYDELMDFYFLSKCKFTVASISGLAATAAFWGKPVLYVNMIQLIYGMESGPLTLYDMLIIKKFYSKKYKRYLNLYEMLEVMNRCDLYASAYKKNDVVLIENTEQEIYDAVVEMNQKIDGVWAESEQERNSIAKYYQIIDKWKLEHNYSITRKRAGARGYQMWTQRICWSFLKNNLYLLDVNV